MALPAVQQATGWLHKADVKTALAGFFKGKKVRQRPLNARLFGSFCLYRSMHVRASLRHVMHCDTHVARARCRSTASRSYWKHSTRMRLVMRCTTPACSATTMSSTKA